MAENHLHQNSSSFHDFSASAPSNAADSANHEAADTTATSTYEFPLRQAMQPIRTEPRIVDITAKFTEACNALEVGQLVKDEHFTLFESIGALEIMDPKMDSGFLQPGETLEDSYDTLSPLLPEEVIGIMDQLLCYEMAWHTGYPLSQTLFTSVYIDKLLWPEPRTLEQAQFHRGEIPDDRRPGTLLEVLRAYCLALIKCCDCVIELITSRDYFEEEDFCTQTYNRVLFPHVPMDVFLRELDAAIERMDDPDLTITDALRTSITTRLEFRKSFLTALAIDFPLDQLSKNWPPVLSSLTTMHTTQQLGTPVPTSFSTKIQRRLASTVPLRPIVELSFQSAFQKLHQLCTDCAEATRLVTLPQTDVLEHESFLWAYSSRSPTPLPYSRSYLSHTLFTLHPTNTALPSPDLQALIFPLPSPITDPTNWTLSPPRNPLLPKPPRLQIALLLDEFLERASIPYIEYWVSLGQNPCRLRRMLGHVVSAWDQLQMDARLWDTEIARLARGMRVQDEVLQKPLETWAYVKKMGMMIKIVLLGFAQDVFLPDEFAGMYFFLGHLAQRRARVLEDIVVHFESTVGRCRARGDEGMAGNVEQQKEYIESLLLESQGMQHLSAALSKFYISALYLGLVAPPRYYPSPSPSLTATPEKSNSKSTSSNPDLDAGTKTTEDIATSQPALRYDLRMRPFLTVAPPEVPPWSDFNAAIQPFGPYPTTSRPANSSKQTSSTATPTPRLPHPTTLKSLQSLFPEIANAIKEAKESYTRLKKLGAKAAKKGGCEEHWGREVNGFLKSCVALGVGVVGVREVVEGLCGGDGGDGKKGLGEADMGDGKEGLGIRLEIPGIGTGERYLEGWVVGRVVKA